MKDGKKIIFTKHAMKRANERLHIQDKEKLIDKFKNSLREDYNIWVSFFIDNDTKYVVSEHAKDFTIITLYPLS